MDKHKNKREIIFKTNHQISKALGYTKNDREVGLE